ncbi:MAG: Fic family protein [Lachnospiraceae bacterium]|nr:Fic family protein [Lachnospiraceae bacterium]
MLLNKNGEKLNENDLQVMEEMIRGSIESHIERLKHFRDSDTVDDPEFYAPILNVYEEGLAYLPMRLREAVNGTEEISATDFIHKYFGDMGKDAADAINMTSDEMINFENLIAGGWGEEHIMQKVFNVGADEKDTAEGYDKSASDFHFSGQKLEGIEDIVSYDPDKDRVKGLYQGRTANSTTLGRDPQKLREELAALPEGEQYDRRREVLQSQIEGYENGTYGLNVGAEVARMHSSELRDKNKVSFGDVYKAYSEINKAMRPGDEAGGKLRGEGVKAGAINGVGASVVPEAVFKTMQTIADGMNEIKNTEDPALKKSMAVELASFAYQMTLSEHSFKDGNGRTCRLFADTILQTFGLPPYTPSKDEAVNLKMHTIGEQMDFAKGTEVLFDGVKESSRVLAGERALEANRGVIGEAGEITEFVRKQAEIKKQFDEEPAPDPVAQPAQYLAHNSRKRSEERKLQAVKNALENAPVSDEQWDMAYNAVMGSINGKKKLPEDAKLVDFAQALEIRMTPEQKKAVSDAMNAYRDPVDMPAEEKVDHIYQNRAAELKANIPADIAADNDLKAQYEHSLDFAAKHLTQVKEAVRADLLSVDKDVQHMEYAVDQNIKNVVRPQYENGKYDNLVVKDNENEIVRLAEGKDAVYDEVINEGIKLSDKTKEGYRLLFAKMDEMGMLAYPYAASGEDGSKAYCFAKLHTDRSTFTEAMDSGDPGKIISAQIIYEKSLRDYDEIFKIAKEHFNQEPGIFPGNMDSIRNKGVPFEFAGDMKTAAQVNAVFQTYIQCKTSGKNPEEYLEEYLANPAGVLLKDAVNKLKPVSFQEVSKGLNLEDSFDLLAGVGAYEFSADEVQYAVPGILFGRQINTANMLESDPGLNKRNQVVAYTTTNAVLNNAIMGDQMHKFKYFNRNDAPDGIRHMKQTIKNLMLAKDEDRNLNAMFSGEPEKDLFGHKIGEGFDATAYIDRKPVDYEGIMDRTNRLINRSDMYGDFAGMLWFAKDNRVRQIAAELYLEVLTAHPEDADKPEYKKMQEELNKTYDAVADKASEETKERARVQKEAAAEMLAENNQKYRILHDPAAYLGALEAEARRTGDFTKYAEGLVTVQMMDQDITDDVETNKRPRTQEELQFSQAYSNYNDQAFNITDPEDKDKIDFFRKTAEAVNALNFKECINYAQEAENMAKRIRNGEATVDPEYADIKTDHRASKNIATQILTGSEADRRSQATLTLKNILNGKSPEHESGMTLFNFDLIKQTQDFIQNGKIGKNAAEREHLLSVGQNGLTPNMSEFGMKWKYLQIPETTDPAAAGKRIQKSLDHVWEYYNDLQDVRMQASQKLEQMKGNNYGGRNGSDEYKAMYDALEKVTKLSVDSTPNQIEQAMTDLKDTATAYTKKIDKQLLANIRSKGKARYQMANDLIEMAQDASENLQGISLEDLTQDEKLTVQMSRAENNVEMYKQKQAQKQAQNVQAPVQNVNAPVQNANVPLQDAPVQNEPVQNANAPQQAQPKQRRKVDMNELTDAIRGERRSDARQRIQERRSLQAEQKEATEQPIRRTRTGV